MLAVTAQPGLLLIADDDEDTRALFRTLLTARGHQVLEASDGVECLRLAHEARPDLIALDLRMPRMDGFEVLARLREDPLTGRVPVLAVTAMAEAAVGERARAAGCDEVIVKPFSPRQLMERVELLLQARGPARG